MWLITRLARDDRWITIDRQSFFTIFAARIWWLLVPRPHEAFGYFDYYDRPFPSNIVAEDGFDSSTFFFRRKLFNHFYDEVEIDVEQGGTRIVEWLKSNVRGSCSFTAIHDQYMRGRPDRSIFKATFSHKRDLLAFLITFQTVEKDDLVK